MFNKFVKQVESIFTALPQSEKATYLVNKFVNKTERIFANLPKPVTWRGFYNHDLGILSVPMAGTLAPMRPGARQSRR
jgi:hypothetical protein